MMREIVLNGRALTYELTRKQVKNINLRVRSNATIHVSASPRVTVASIERFMQENSERILSAVDKASQREALRQKRELFEDGSSIFFLGDLYRLCVRLGAKNAVVLADGALLLIVTDPSDPILRK